MSDAAESSSTERTSVLGLRGQPRPLEAGARPTRSVAMATGMLGVVGFGALAVLTLDSPGGDLFEGVGKAFAAMLFGLAALSLGGVLAARWNSRFAWLLLVPPLLAGGFCVALLAAGG